MKFVPARKTFSYIGSDMVRYVLMNVGLHLLASY